MFQATPIPIYDDNYVWIIQHEARCIIVDPGDAQPVLAYLDSHNLIPDTILVTHKHWDHVTGISAIKNRFPDIHLYGPEFEDIPHRDTALAGGEVLSLAGLEWSVLALPGHTMGHIGFMVTDHEQQTHLFSGDTLFACGCGRMFEGTPSIYQATLSIIRDLPVNTLIYGTHEYTLANIDFALNVEPNNTRLLHRQDVFTALREQNTPTLPTTVGEERMTNPFLRWDQPDIIRAVQHRTGEVLVTPEEVFGAVRAWKDAF